MPWFKKSESAEISAAKAGYEELIAEFDNLTAHSDDIDAVINWIDRIGQFRATAEMTPDDLAPYDQSAFDAAAEFILSDESVSAGLTKTDVNVLAKLSKTVELTSTEAGQRLLALYGRFYRIGCANGGLLSRVSDPQVMTRPGEDVWLIRGLVKWGGGGLSGYGRARYGR